MFVDPTDNQIQFGSLQIVVFSAVHQVKENGPPKSPAAEKWWKDVYLDPWKTKGSIIIKVLSQLC